LVTIAPIVTFKMKNRIRSGAGGIAWLRYRRWYVRSMTIIVLTLPCAETSENHQQKYEVGRVGFEPTTPEFKWTELWSQGSIWQSFTKCHVCNAVLIDQMKTVCPTWHYIICRIIPRSICWPYTLIATFPDGACSTAIIVGWEYLSTTVKLALSNSSK
jgi:hypothetical protein